MTEIKQGQIWEKKTNPEEKVFVVQVTPYIVRFRDSISGDGYLYKKMIFRDMYKPAKVWQVNAKSNPLIAGYSGTRNEQGQKHDPVNHPKHYTSDPSGVECIEITRHRNFNIGNAFKYLWRAGLKDGNSDIDDLKKAIWYIQDEIKRLEGEQ